MRVGLLLAQLPLLLREGGARQLQGVGLVQPLPCDVGQRVGDLVGKRQRRERFAQSRHAYVERKLVQVQRVASSAVGCGWSCPKGNSERRTRLKY
eukprot:scaffold11416_cov119-Isochrysis_galbana.AAC.9